MSDSEASTDPEDFEYIPEGDVGGSDSEASVGGEEEEKRGVSRPDGKLRKTFLDARKCRGRGGGDVWDGTNGGEGEEEEERGGGSGEGEAERHREEERERKEKARVDDLWESFKKDTAKKTKEDSATGGIDRVCSKDENPKVEPSMVKIKKTYDFAGSEVVVEREVAAGSKEAQQFTAQESTSSSSSTSSVVSEARKPASAATPVRESSLAGEKRSGLSSVLQSLTKRPKMSTLEKSQFDWNKFKADEGLEHELAQERKDSYLEKQEFLQRTDVRQYELEREERLKKYRRLH